MEQNKKLISYGERFSKLSHNLKMWYNLFNVEAYGMVFTNKINEMKALAKRSIKIWIII